MRNLSFVLGKMIVLLVCCLLTLPSAAQQEINARRWVKSLCSDQFNGRGYVDHGVGKASRYLIKEFKHLGLKKGARHYIQTYSFPVNTHPQSIVCEVDGQSFSVGRDFLVNAGATSIKGTFQLLHFREKDSLEHLILVQKIARGFADNEALVLHHSNPRNSSLSEVFARFGHRPKLIIYTEDKKLTHTVSTRLDTIPSLIMFDSLLTIRKEIKLNLENTFIPKYTCNNIIGYIPGERNDSFLVFSAHYDHLGMQGQALFPGASDNASGVSMVLNLAAYYAKHKPKYTTYFILFSGEEAGLLGSRYFTEHPTFEIKRIKLLTNIDIMGNAENGITVVNGSVYQTYFDQLSEINRKNNYLPEVRIRGEARNSDHYYFSAMGIPAIFIYSLGGNGYYHDIDDTYEHLGFKNYEEVFKLLLTFTQQL